MSLLLRRNVQRPKPARQEIGSYLAVCRRPFGSLPGRKAAGLLPLGRVARRIIPSDRETFIRRDPGRGVAASTRRKCPRRSPRDRALSRSPNPPARLATGGLRVRRQRDSRAGTESGNGIAMGPVGALRQEGDAVSQRGQVRGECRGRKADAVRRTKMNPRLWCSLATVEERESAGIFLGCVLLFTRSRSLDGSASA